MADAPRKGGKLNVFVAYSGDDREFANQLDAALAASGVRSVADGFFHNPPGQDVKTTLGTLIRRADAFVFVLSPSSARSEICRWELDAAMRAEIRVLTVVARPLDGVSPPPQLTDRQWIVFYREPTSPGSGFGDGLARLIVALTVDVEWLEEHTRYLKRATDWIANGRARARLLSESDVAVAKDWAARRPESARPTPLVLEFIRTSEDERRRRELEAKQGISQPASEIVVEKRREVFLSYATKNNAAAEAVCAALEGKDIGVWMWPRDAVPGVSYARAIVDAIDNAIVAVLVFSAAANASDDIEREVALTIKKKKLVIPFRIEDVSPKGPLEYWITAPQYLDAFNPPIEPHFERLVAVVRRIAAHGVSQ
jgi:TIR domain